MDMKMSIIAMAGICAIVLAIGFLRRRAEIVLNFMVRTVLGVMAICFFNMLLAGAKIPGAVGLKYHTINKMRGDELEV